MMRTLALIVVALVALSGCAYAEPAASGTVVDKHMTGAQVTQRCSTVSAVPYTEDCQKVHVPDKCYVYVETTADVFVEAEVWCDDFENVRVGERFEDGPAVMSSVCARHDEHGRWETIASDDCDFTDWSS